MKKIAVIIPTYNRASFLSTAIESVLTQSNHNIEVIVVDDGSTDHTKELMAKYAPRVRYIFQENRGCAAARNFGARITSSEYIVFLDSDDLLAPDKLAIQSTLLDKIPEAGFVYSDSIEFRIDNGKVMYYLQPAVARNNPDTFLMKHFLSLGVRPGSLMVRRALFESVGGFEERMRYNEDSDFIQRLALKSRPIFSDYPSIVQRHHSSNKSKNRLEIYEAVLFSCEKLLEDAPELYAIIGAKRVQKRLDELRGILDCLSSKKGPAEPSNVLAHITAGLLRRMVSVRRAAGDRILRRRQLRYMKETMQAIADYLA